MVTYICDICKNECKDKAYMINVYEIDLNPTEFAPFGEKKFDKHVIFCEACYESSYNNLPADEHFNPYAGPLAMHD